MDAYDAQRINKVLFEKHNNHQNTKTALAIFGNSQENIENRGKETTNHYRNINNISVVGRHKSEPARTFDDFKVDERQILACAQAGSGKTAAFLVPIIQTLKGTQRQGFRALILCPTRELAKQTQRIYPHYYTKQNMLLIKTGSSSSIFEEHSVAYNCEADKLFEEGSRSFRDQLNEILVTCDNKDRKIAMFSATYTPIVAKWCVHNMKGLMRNTATDLVDQELLFVGNEQGKLLALRDLVRKGLESACSHIRTE
ncbi:hypothetical protein NQ317_000309 [Molorchus minor]|uniref:ATP-dependent RNA helicase n=1 Tax=Molorchus minor TaxID=1323400 RepID=A0ABQ9IVM8_9CUCU|nr:hypothetical protein NQ317_000309 [Molorchus minor]